MAYFETCYVIDILHSLQLSDFSLQPFNTFAKIDKYYLEQSLLDKK